MAKLHGVVMELPISLFYLLGYNIKAMNDSFPWYPGEINHEGWLGEYEKRSVNHEPLGE